MTDHKAFETYASGQWWMEGIELDRDGDGYSDPDAQAAWEIWQAAQAALKAYKLPCDVRLPPATKISKGCPLNTLLKSMNLREGVAPELIQFPDNPAKKAGELWDELNSKRCMACGEFHSNLFIPCPKTIPMSISHD